MDSNKFNRILYAQEGAKTDLKLVGKNKFILKKIILPVLSKIVSPVLGWINKVNPDIAKFLGYKEEDEWLSNTSDNANILQQSVNYEQQVLQNNNGNQSSTPTSITPSPEEDYQKYILPYVEKDPEAARRLLEIYETYSPIINKSFAPFFHGDKSGKDFWLLGTQIPLLNSFYKEYFKLRNGFTFEEANTISDIVNESSLDRNISLRLQALSNAGLKLKTDKLNLNKNVKVEGYYWPFDENGKEIPMQYRPETKDIRIGIKFLNNPRFNNLAFWRYTLLHEREHSVQHKIAEKALLWIDNELNNNTSLGKYLRRDLNRERDNILNNWHTITESSILDEAYPIITLREYERFKKSSDKDLYKSDYIKLLRDLKIFRMSQSAELAAVNSEIRQRYIDSGIKFDEIQNYWDLPDFFTILPNGRIGVYYGVDTQYMVDYLKNIKDDILYRLEKYKLEHPDTSDELIKSLQETLISKKNDAIKRAVLYVGSTLGVAYMLNQTENND